MDDLLIIETASSHPFLFLKTKGRETLVSLDNGLNLSKNIHISLKSLLVDSKLEDLKILAVGVGPGSFTGLRVGVSIAQTLSFASKIPLTPFCSCFAFSSQEPSDSAVIFDARSQGLYILENGEQQSQRVPLDEGIAILQTKKKIFTPDPNLLVKLEEFSLPISIVLPNIPTLISHLEPKISNDFYKPLPLIYP